MGEVKQEPAWLLAKADQRLALMSAMIDTPEKKAAIEMMDAILTPLVEPPEGGGDEAYERWDKTCDNCGKYCPTTLYTGHLMRTLLGVKVTMMFGVCQECKDISA